MVLVILLPRGLSRALAGLSLRHSPWTKAYCPWTGPKQRSTQVSRVLFPVVLIVKLEDRALLKSEMLEVT